MTIEKKKSKNYIENEMLYEQILSWKTEYDKIKAESGKEIGVSNELTISIYTIAKRLATRYNFNGYPFRDDMVQDAMYVILKYMRNYDLSKTNPHAYITTCCWNAFRNRINIEKKNAIKKYKHYINFVETNGDLLARETGTPIDYDIVNQMYDRVNEFESKPNNLLDEENIEMLDKNGNTNLRGFFSDDKEEN